VTPPEADDSAVWFTRVRGVTGNAVRGPLLAAIAADTGDLMRLQP
jgi:hypothetical protein